MSPAPATRANLVTMSCNDIMYIEELVIDKQDHYYIYIRSMIGVVSFPAHRFRFQHGATKWRAEVGLGTRLMIGVLYYITTQSCLVICVPRYPLFKLLVLMYMHAW